MEDTTSLERGESSFTAAHDEIEDLHDDIDVEEVYGDLNRKNTNRKRSKAPLVISSAVYEESDSEDEDYVEEDEENDKV
ncbi:hypothetical protein ACHQM5_021229 [Ranunculus cassubicifolius]